MAWKPPEEELDQNLNQQWKPPKNELDWKPPEEELDNSPTKIKDVGTLQQMKASGQKLTDEQEKILWKAEEDKPILQKASEVVSTFIPTAVDVFKTAGQGAANLAYHGVLAPIDAMSQSEEEAAKTFKKAANTWRSWGIGQARDIEEKGESLVQFVLNGSGITDRLLGMSEDERFQRHKSREALRQTNAAFKEDNPDRLNYLLSENPWLQKMAGAYARLAGATPEEAKLAEQGFSDILKETGLTKEEIDESVALFAEISSPVAIPGTNTVTKFLSKPVVKGVQKTGELALKGIKPIAELVEGGADLTLKGTELIQGGAKKLGEYTVNDPDTWFKTTANTIVTPVNLVAKPTRSVARVVKDVTAQADVGGAAGRRGLFERAGRAGASSDLTRRLFGPQGKGGVARAKVADWTVRQANAIIQPGVNGAALNVILGLPNIETAADLGYTAGTGFGIGAFGGARIVDRAGAIIDPTTSLAEKITTVVTPDLAQRRLDEDADIKRFLATATPEMKSQMADLSNIDKRKTAIDSKLINLRQQKERTINAADEANLQRQIDGFEKQRQALDKATPETVREAERQVQLAFMDAMDLAQATGTSAGLRGLNLTVLNADNAEGFFRNLYGGAVERAEGVVNLLTGRTDLTMQESQNLQQARELLNRFSTEVAGAKNQRGFAIGVDGTDPNADGYVAPHLRKVNQTGATAVINGDLVKHLSEQGFDVRRVINHEMQHALQQFREVKDMLSPIRGDLFDQKVVKDDGTVEVWKQGIFSDADIARYGANYAAKMSPADNGASFIAQFQDVDAFNAYIKDEILAEVASQTGDYSNGTRAALDDVGRNLVDWLEVKTKAGALRKMKEGLRTFGIVFDNYGGYSNVLGADLPPEALAMIRQYQRQLRDFDGSMQIQTTREQDAPDIPMTAILGSRALQEKYKDADFFEKEQILRSTAPDGTVTEIVMPKGAKLDPFVDIYRIQGGQLVDANGNPVQLPPEITFGSLPEGSTFQMDTRIARKPDGSPITLSAREIKSRALERTQSIRNVIDSAPDDGSPNRLIDTGNGNYRGIMSPSQLAAVLAIPNNVLAPALKKQIIFFNELMQRGDGTRAIFEYQAALLNGKYKAISPKIRDEVPIGWQFTKDGNFALTTISVSRLYDKLQAWADQGTVTQEQTWTGELIPVKRSKNLALWNGDTNKFWNSLVQVLDNHANGREGWVGLHSDELTAKRMRNKVNDLFNVFNKETKEMNPDRSTLPRVRGRDNVDIIVRSRRVDRINSFSESPSTKVPVNYGKLLINYMPETNPLAAPQTPEQFMQNINGSVSATRIRNAIATGAVDQLEAELRNSDDLLPTESLFVSQGEGGDPLIQVTSMLDPNVEGALEPEEMVVDLDARTAAELARLEAEEAAAMAAQQQAQAPAEPAPAPEPAPEPAPAPTTQFMPDEGNFEQIRRDAINKRNKRRDEAYEILYSVIPETADILKRKINFEDDQQEFNSIPFSMPSVGFNYDRSFHLTKIVRRILDTLDPMADTKAIQNLRRKWDTASPIDKQDIEDRIKKYEDRIKKTASTMKYAFGVFADLTASLPEAKARDLRQDKIVDPWVVLKKHFPDGESKDINKVILELRDIIKFGTEKENFKSSINNVLNAAEVLRDFTDVDQSVIDQLFKDRYNKSEAQIKKDEEEFFKEVTNPEFYDVEKRGTATFSQKIEPQGGIQFMPAESDAEYLRLAQNPEQNREQLQAMVDEAAKAAGYEPKKLFHGTLEGGFTKFDPEKIGSANDKGWFGKAFWFSDDYGYSAANYAGEYRGKLPKRAEVKKVYLSLKNPKIIPWVAEDEKARRTSDPESATQNAINQGHDGFLVQKNPRYGEWYEYGVFDPSQIKSADPVTYDDAGNVIPLSQRFQTTSPDIRFMPAEQGPLADIQAPEQKKEQKVLAEIEPVSDVPKLPKKYAYGYTTSSDRIKLVSDLAKSKNWNAIRDLNQATIRHAMSDLPGVKYTIKDVLGAFEDEREVSALPEFEINTPEELAAVRKRMVSLAELWDQTEVLEEEVGGGNELLLGTVDNDGYLHTGKYALTFDKLTPSMVEKARKAAGIQSMTIDGNTVVFYDTDNNPAEFTRRVTEFGNYVSKNGGILESWSTGSTKIRSYRNPKSPKAGSLYYNEDPIRLFGAGQAPDRLRTKVYRVVSELLGRPLPPPKDGRSSYFVKEDVTPKQVKLQNNIAKKQDAVVLNDKGNKDVVKAYEELNKELLKQYDALIDAGMEFYAAPDYETYEKTYKSSADVIADIRNNNKLVYLQTNPATFGPQKNGKPLDFSFHPLLKNSGRKDKNGNEMNYNDILRVVHDAIAHGIYSAQFGPIGEESAWHTHIRTIDNPWARWALTMETRAQNSWVNYQDKFLNKEKMPKKPGDEGYIPIKQREYAMQKFALIPLKFALTGEAKVDKPVLELIEQIGPKRAEGSKERRADWMPSKQKEKEILSKVTQPPGDPKKLFADANSFLGKPTKKDGAESTPVIVAKEWFEKKTDQNDGEEGEEAGETITVGKAELKDVVLFSQTAMPLVVQPLPNYFAENNATKVSKNVLAIAKNPTVYKAYTDRVVAAGEKIKNDPQRFVTLSGYLEFMRESGASGNLLMPPSQLAEFVKNPQYVLDLWNGGYHGKKTIPGTIAAAKAGLDSVNEMRDLFIVDGKNLGPTPMITALHHLWGILSRQLDPLNQEGMWMRLVSDTAVIEQIQLSIDGKFTLSQEEWQKVVQAARKATKGEYSKIGNNATSNANAFHHMLKKHNGKWNELAAIYTLDDAVKMTNAFWGLNVGATGIKNKVQRFIGLTFGIHGSVLDRWRFVSLNLPMAMKLRGAQTPESYFRYYGKNKTIPEDPVGIYKSYGTVENGNLVFSTALYAGIDKVIEGMIANSPEMRDFLGVHATAGGFHWIDWNCVKNEAVGHSSLELTKEFLKRKGRKASAEDFLDVVKNTTVYTRADQDGKIFDLVMENGIFRVREE